MAKKKGGGGHLHARGNTPAPTTQRLFHIGAATHASGARSVNKGQIWGKFEANLWAAPKSSKIYLHSLRIGKLF
ncbi:hypothetical protein ACHAW5_000280 [Stephanodiscus triporus]|uniref:Uncharacterized protein n=1 Tax=Stephanodiscus triporus TaxID=2934178 RepID=A0ABD3MMZ6_9STRA